MTGERGVSRNPTNRELLALDWLCKAILLKAFIYLKVAELGTLSRINFYRLLRGSKDFTGFLSLFKFLA